MTELTPVALPYMFPRGNGPLVSILIASRGRATHLENSIRTTYENAQDKSRIEFVVKADNDDIDTLTKVEQLKQELFPITLISTDRGGGFRHMNQWVDLMCQEANGDWLILLNDDAYIETKSWDTLIATGGVRIPKLGYEHLTLYQLKENGNSDSGSFPCVRKTLISILGHFSPVLACDLWVRKLAATLEFRVEVPINVVHARIPHEGMEVRKGVVAANGLINWQLNSIFGLQHFAADLACLIHWLAKYEKGLAWQPAPVGDGWQWWCEVRGGVELLVYVHGEMGIWMPRLSDCQAALAPVQEARGWWAKCPEFENIGQSKQLKSGWLCPDCYGHGKVHYQPNKVTYQNGGYLLDIEDPPVCTTCAGSGRVQVSPLAHIEN